MNKVSNQSKTNKQLKNGRNQKDKWKLNLIFEYIYTGVLGSFLLVGDDGDLSTILSGSGKIMHYVRKVRFQNSTIRN